MGCASTIESSSGATAAYRSLYSTEMEFSEGVYLRKLPRDEEGESYESVLQIKKMTVLLRLHEQMGDDTSVAELQSALKRLAKTIGVTGAFNAPNDSIPADMRSRYDVLVRPDESKNQATLFYRYLVGGGD